MENMAKLPGLDQVMESDEYKKHGLKFFGAGAEKLCFKTDASEKKLIKVNLNVLRDKILALVNSPNEGAGEDTDDIAQYEAELMNGYRNQEQDIIEVFGKEHVLKKGYFHYKIPITHEVIMTALGERGKDVIDKIGDEVPEVELLVETQNIADELVNRDERYTIDFRIPLIRYDQFKDSQNIQEGLYKIEANVDREIDENLEKLANKNQYVLKMKVILEKIIEYTKKTGRMVDIFGPGNITIFLNKDNEFDFHLVDPILPGMLEKWDKSMSEDKDLRLIRHNYTYYYGVNYMAKKLGLEERLGRDDLIYFKNAPKFKGFF